MRIGNNVPASIDAPPLSAFELPPWFVEPAVRSGRLFNTTLDFLFYDVLTLRAGLADRRSDMQVMGDEQRGRSLNFDALSDPEGSLLLIDATHEPYVHTYRSVEEFLASPRQEARDVEVATISGVGSSALGSAALAWDISIALQEPVLGIVPGYGVADVVLQGMGGWFGFGLYNYLGTKSIVQYCLASAAPQTAAIGRGLSATTPDAETVNGGPVYRHGSGSSDVLHALLEYRDAPFRLLVGHSKGALQIGNAICSLPSAKTGGLQLVTLGCPIAKTVPGVVYHQFLGLYDALGQINMWGNLPDKWIPTWHSTNPVLPPAMAAGELTEESAGD